MPFAAGYIRLSDTDQSNYSIPAQENGIREYCANNNLTLSEIFTDNGESSYTFDRKHFTRLETTLKNKRVTYIIVYHLDRFSRNMPEALQKISSLLDRGIKVRDISEPLAINDNSIEVFTLRTMKFFSADIELRRIRERTKMGMRQAYQEGRWVNKAPYGYINKRDERNKPTLEIDPVRAQHVRDAYGLFLQGLDKEQTRQASGITMKGNSAMNRVLSQSLYAGLINYEGKFLEAKCEPLISREVYFAVQSKLNPKKEKPVHGSDKAFLKGMIYCICGQRLTSANPKSHTGKIHWYYHCPKCELNFRMQDVHDKILQIFEVVELSEDGIKELREKTLKAVREYISTHSGNIEFMRKKLTGIELKLQTAQKKYLITSGISAESFANITGELQTEAEEIRSHIDRLAIDEEIYTQTLDNTLSNLRTLKDRFQVMDFAERQRTINIIFPGVLFYTKEGYRTPFSSSHLRDNELILKQKGLLEIQKSLMYLGGTPLRAPGGSFIELILQKKMYEFADR